jgi:UDP-N-acetylmuramyl pentapeptide phosphotransferase/UDP-N-acetylglucosamine-1-phosphate transferase
MIAHYWETRDGSPVRLAIYVAALVVFLISAVPSSSASTFVILLFGFIGLTGILDEYRRWRRAVTSRRRPG